MKQLIALFFVLFAIPFSLALYGHTYETSTFSIDFPGQPSQTSEVTETEYGPMTIHRLMYESDNEAYLFAYSDYLEVYVERNDPVELCNNAKDGFINSMGIQISFERRINLNGHAGIYFKAQGNGYYCNMKIYLVKNRLYHIGILRQGRFSSDAEVRSYIDTFKLM